MGPGLSEFFVFGGNRPKPVLIFWSSIPLLKVVSYYDLSVLSMLVMRLQNKKFGWGWVGGVSSIQFYLGFLEFV